MPFFVELPVDEYGNRGYTHSFPCVIEAEVVESDIGTRLVIKAPGEIKAKWPSILQRSHGGWLEVEGPARPLTWNEREELIAATQRIEH